MKKDKDIVRERDGQNAFYDSLFTQIKSHPFNGNINADCFNLQFLASINNVEIGRGGSHIWIAEPATKERIGIIYY